MSSTANQWITPHIEQAHSSAPVVWQDLSDDQVALIKRTIAKDATNDELALFVTQANKKRLDPFSNQIWFTKRQGKVSILTGIDGYRLIADRTGRHAGTETRWCGTDGAWRDVWLEKDPPAAAKVTVQKVTDFGVTATHTGIALWSEYGEKADGFMFKKMPAAQLAKCAEALALRKAFPSETSGVYTQEEMAQADTPAVAQAEQAPTSRRRPPPTAVSDGMVSAAEAKSRVLAACSGDKEEAAALWGARGSTPIPETELVELVAQAAFDAEIVDEPPFE